MKKEVADKWVHDLRNTEAKQAKGELCTEDGAYCCLGRLCIVLGYEFENGSCLGELFTLPQAAVEEAGMSDDTGIPRDFVKIAVNGIEYDDLACANDDGRTFAEIADAIEANWERL